MRIVRDQITNEELKSMSEKLFGNLVKAVVDVNKEIIAVDAELHADLETAFLENGSKQADLWGINLYPEVSGGDFVEFDSMINLRPSQNNRSRGVDDGRIRERIISIVNKRVKR